MIPIRTRNPRCLAALVALALCALPAPADVLILADGKAVEGEVADRGETYEVKTRYGVLTIKKSDVKQIIKGSEAAAPAPPAEPAAPTMPEKPPVPPAPSVIELAQPAPPPTVDRPETRRPVPDAAKRREAEAALRKVFKIEGAKSAVEKAAMARDLLQAAASSGARDAELYVLLINARDLAVGAADVKTALDAVGAMAAAFEIDAVKEKIQILTKAQAHGPEGAAWARLCLDVSHEAEESLDYDAASKLASSAEALARSAKDAALVGAAKDRSKELQELRLEADRMKGHFKTLETKPDDPAANAAVGKFLCLVKENWEKGLPMLAKGSDDGLKALAGKELAKPSDAVAQAALGEGWAAQAGKESGKHKAGATARAAEWLERAIPNLTGLVKVSAQKTLASLKPAGGSKGPLTLDLGGGVRLELVYIKPGVFTMGGTDAPRHGWQRDERPEHPVTLTKGFYLGKYEVTRGQFAAFVKATGNKTDAHTQAQADDHPAAFISWNDAKAFCDWAAKKTGRGARLPTEAEWEYACRAGTKTRWLFGDNEGALGDHAWTNANSGGQTHPVGRKKPNPWGVYDMYGNVWEWCEDWEGPYAAGAVTDPTGAVSGKARCFRGGSWSEDPTDCRSAFRTTYPPSYPGADLARFGFRVAVR